MHVAFNSLTVELFIDGSAKLLIPLPPAFGGSKEIVPTGLKSSIAEEALRSYIAEDRGDHSLYYLHFLDVGRLYSSIILLLNYYLDWLGDLSLLSAFKTALILNDVWRQVPFADKDEWGIHVTKFGLPIMSADLIKIPEDIGHGMIFPLEKDAPLIWASIIGNLGLTFGLPNDLISSFLKDEFSNN